MMSGVECEQFVMGNSGAEIWTSVSSLSEFSSSFRFESEICGGSFFVSLHGLYRVTTSMEGLWLESELEFETPAPTPAACLNGCSHISQK